MPMKNAFPPKNQRDFTIPEKTPYTGVAKDVLPVTPSSNNHSNSQQLQVFNTPKSRVCKKQRTLAHMDFEFLSYLRQDL